MKSYAKALSTAFLIGGMLTVCTPLLAESNSTPTDSWGSIGYTHWPTKMMYGRGHRDYAVTETTSPNQKIKVDLLSEGWYAVFRPDETTRDRSNIIGYIPASAVYLQPLTNAHPIISNPSVSAVPPDYTELLQEVISLTNAKEYNKAVIAGDMAVATAQKALGSNHADVATCLVSLGHVYEAGQHYDIARQIYEQALSIDETSAVTNSFLVASDLNDLARCHYHLEEYKEAEALFDRSLALCIESTGETSGATTQILRSMMALYKATERPALAAEYERRIKLNYRPGVVTSRNSGTSGGSQIDFGIFGNRTPGAPITDGEIRALNFVAEALER